MVTRKKAKKAKPPTPRPPLYIEETMAEVGLGDQAVADKLGVARETVTRYRTHQTRLNPKKIARIASVLKCQPAELWYPPGKLRQAIADLTLKGPEQD